MFHGSDLIVQLVATSGSGECLRAQLWFAIEAALTVIDAQRHAAGAAAVAFHPGAEVFDHSRAFANHA